jgi:hypothetical protein
MRKTSPHFRAKRGELGASIFPSVSCGIIKNPSFSQNPHMCGLIRIHPHFLSFMCGLATSASSAWLRLDARGCAKSRDGCDRFLPPSCHTNYCAAAICRSSTRQLNAKSCDSIVLASPAILSAFPAAVYDRRQGRARCPQRAAREMRANPSQREPAGNRKRMVSTLPCPPKCF